MAMAGEVQMYLSDAILAEYNEVLRRPCLDIPPEKIASALANIREAARMVHPAARVTAASDPDDNMFLECAHAAQAHYLVTGNVRHFPATWMRIRVLSPRHFLDETSAMAEGSP
jgi:putative PIN family toxin of toxin-antitoxin system